MNDKKNKTLVGKYLYLILFLIVAGLVASYFFIFKAGPKEKYDEVLVTKGDINIEVLATGTVQPENRLEIKSPIAGRVERIMVKEGDKIYKGQVLAWMSSTERAALLDAARAKGAEELKKWEDLYRPTPVVSPISGTLILKNVESGQTFTNVDAIFVLSNRLTVKAQVDETDIASVKVGQEAQIILDAYSDQKVTAKVLAIAFDATTVNNVTTYLVDVAPLETPDFMRSGMTANVKFLIRTLSNILLIPNSTIDFSTNEKSVWLKNGPNNQKHKELKAIDVGGSDGKMSEVRSGLKEGDIILLKQITGEEGTKGFNPLAPMRNRNKK